jgi:hypothetical protein
MRIVPKKFINPAIIAVCLLAAPTGGFAKPTQSGLASDKTQVAIRVSGQGWGSAPVKEIQAVLCFAAGELLEYFPGRRLHPIIVEHDEDGPITLYRRGPNKEYIVQLDVEDTNWAQFVYQFSHELTHILARREGAKANRHPNKWFEEVLCVAASLFTLRRLAVTPRTPPPQLSRDNYPPFLRRYADHHMSKPGRQLPAGLTLAKWYKENADSLRHENERSEEARDKQYLIASQLLPVFERNPELWESVGYLNAGKPDKADSFESYLNKWHANSPEQHKRLIREIADMFKE